MSEEIPLARPSISDAERSAAQRVLSTPQLTGGPELARFEESFANYLGSSACVALSSGTAALELSLWALGISPGDEVLVCAFGFPAAANAVAARGAIPIAVDVREDSWCMDFELAKSFVNPRVKALICIDQFGALSENREIQAFRGWSGLPVISDSACGLGGLDSEGKQPGKAANLATFSFHPRKNITTGEGGAVVSDDLQIVEKLRRLRNHGQGNGFAHLGTNARLSELSCALGNAQLARLEAMQAEREMLVVGYKDRLELLRKEGAIAWQELPEGAKHANQCFALQLAPEIERARLVEILRAKGIGCGPATYAFHEIGLHGAHDAPVASELHRRALALPLYLGMRSRQLDIVCTALREGIREIRA